MPNFPERQTALVADAKQIRARGSSCNKKTFLLGSRAGLARYILIFQSSTGLLWFWNVYPVCSLGYTIVRQRVLEGAELISTYLLAVANRRGVIGTQVQFGSAGASC